MIRVLLVDDQTLVRQGIRSLLDLSSNIEVVGEARDGTEVLPFLESQKVDVILLDLQMPKMDGVELLALMKAKEINIPCLILTTFDDDERLLRCAELNAKGYMLKDVDFEQLVANIEKVASGELLIHQTVSQTLLRGLQHRAAEPSGAGQTEALTPREHDVLKYMAGGYSNREIARAIHLTEGTVKNHVSSILSKLGVRDRTRAVIKALECGWLS